MFCLASMFQKLYEDPFLAHMPSFAVTMGSSLQEAALPSTVGFVTSAITLIIISVISNFMSNTHRVLLLVMACGVGTVSVIILLSVRSYIGVIVASTLCGTHLGNTMVFFP